MYHNINVKCMKYIIKNIKIKCKIHKIYYKKYKNKI